MTLDFPKLEQKILKFWSEKKVFEKSLKKTKNRPRFVFYEGPPFANGLPGIHHLLARAFKDIILRYKTMQGFFVERRAGWDTHGLPTEMEAEKKLGIKSKKEIEKIGIEKFIDECKNNVFTYKKEWEEFTERIGFWLDFKKAYITCDNKYIETLWWILKQIWQKGLLYQDYKVVPYCPRCIDGNSKILTSSGLSKPIKELKNCQRHNKIIAFDDKNNKISTAAIKDFINLKKEPVFKLSTNETKRSIIATADHPFWVKGKGWVPFDKVNIGDKVAIYPYFEISEDKSKSRKILDEKKLENIITEIELKRNKKRIREYIDYRNLITINKWKIDKQIRAFRKKGYTFREIQKKILSKYRVKISFNVIQGANDVKTRSRTLEHVIQELKNKDLLPLTTTSSKLPIIARLLGHIFGDGFLIRTSGKRINLVLGFTGKENDFNDIRKDLNELGFSYEPIRKRFVTSILKDRTIQGYSTEFRVNSIALATLLITLGAPIGKKSRTYFEIPRWLFGAPKHIVREFLAAYFGSELGKIRIQGKRGFEALRFSLNKDEKLVENGCNFVRQISKLLKKFDVKIQKIRLKPVYDRKDSSKSVKIMAVFSASKKNLLNFCKYVGYCYSKERESFALYVREYLELRKIIEKEKTQQYQIILRLKERDLSSERISQNLNIKTERVNEILGRKSKKDIRIWNIPEFKDWLKDATEGLPDGVVWETIGRIEKMGKRNVFDFHLDKLHGFIVNGFITHNCGTSLSSHEVAQGYKRIKENSIYVKLKVKNQKNTYFLVWTTTPWTLPGNVALAVNPGFEYVKVKIGNEFFILAKQRAKDFEVVEKIKRAKLLGLKYEPLYKFIKPDKKAFYVVASEFVSLEEGTGIVHMAPAFGEEDMEVAKLNDLPVLMTVNEEGKFKTGDWKGMFVKEADPLIIKDLEKRKLLYKQEIYEHDYPFCWRCKSPLLYYAKNSWFIKMTEVKKALIKNSQEINWEPEYIKKGRFGEWLKEIKDWNLSRERYWGTPLPVWQCQTGKSQIPSTKSQTNPKPKTQNPKQCNNIKVIGSVEELEKLSGKKIKDLHRPYIDEVTFKCDECRGVMKRVPEVVDCWFDSGSMPFAQWHYPFDNKNKIDKSEAFPADFISEAIDQTRGWFYTLLALSTLLAKGAPYKNVICLGLVLDAKGQKMSKSRGNIIEPKEVIDKFGADCARFYFYTINPAGEPKRFDFKDAQNLYRKFFDTLWQCYAFFETYVSKKEIQNSKATLRGVRFASSKIQNLGNVLDKWIISRLENLNSQVIKKLDDYDVVGGARLFLVFVDDLSNWYIRRSRQRFKDSDKEAMQTLFYVLLKGAKLLAPFTPFIAEELFQKLNNGSVHLEDYPKPDKKLIDHKLEEKMKQVREIVAESLAQRAKAGIKVRQPLASLQITEKLDDNFLDLIKDEVNVKKITFGKKIKLDTKITKKLKEEGIAREIIRQIQEMRKKAGLKPKDRIIVESTFEPRDKESFKKSVGAKLLQIKKRVTGKEIQVGKEKHYIEIKKI